MTNSNIVNDVGTLILDGKPYRILRPPGQNTLTSPQLSYRREYVNSPPYQQGEPAELSVAMFTWHLGGFKSRVGSVGTSEYGQNTDDQLPYMILPGPAINPVTLTSNTQAITSVFEAMGYIWVVAGQRIYRIHPTTLVVTLSKTFAGGVTAVMGLRWETNTVLVCTDEATNSLYQCTVIGSPDTWVTSDVSAYQMVAGLNRLFKVTKTGQLSNIRTGLSPIVNANWADSVQVGRTDSLPQSMVAYERTALVGKPEGLFSVGDTGNGVPEIQRMQYDPTNCYGMAVQDPWILVPHVRGLYQFIPGQVTSAGLETEVINESPVRGRVVQVVTDGDKIYLWVEVDTSTYVLTARDKRRGEGSLGPYILDTWLYYTSTTRGAYLQASGVNPRLWFGTGTSISYVALSAGGGAPDAMGSEYRFNTPTGVRYFYRMNFDDRNPKAFRRIDCEVANVDASNYWTLEYSIDGSAYSALDATGASMRANTAGLTTFWLPVAAVGREIQVRATYTNASTTVAPRLKYVEVFAVPQAKKVGKITVQLLLQQGVMLEEGFDNRDALTQQSDLIALRGLPTPVVAIGPFGTIYVTVKEVEIKGDLQMGQDAHSFVAEVTLQERS